MMRELGNAPRLPLAPAIKRKEPMLAAMPMHSVDTSGLMNCMVSKIDSPALTLPPGELMYRKMSLSGVLALQEEHLRDDHVGRLVVDRADEKDDALAQQARVDVVRPLAAAGLFDDDGHQAEGPGVE